MKTIGETLRAKREQKKLLLRHVSSQLNIDMAILSKIERGSRNATRKQIEKLADILEIEKETLLVQYLGEKILYELKNDDQLGLKAIKAAERRIKYNLTKTK